MARWPDDPLLRFGAANMLLAQGDRAGAEEALRELLLRAPADMAARNNYAELLSQRGCRAAALAEITVAQAHARGTPLAAVIDTTANEIAARAADPVAPCPR
jgi:predicted Zn-dependent protease